MPAAVLLVCLLAAGTLVLWLGARCRKQLRRKRVRQRPFPTLWQGWLKEDFPRYQSLPNSLREDYHRHIQVIVEEKNFEACGGFPEITERVKVLISAQAALLLAGHPDGHGYYPRLRSVLVYPGAFRDPGRRRFDVPERDPEPHLGESWSSGSVVLSWANVVAGAQGEDDGINVVIHEFAHQLDQDDGTGDGVPLLRDREAYRKWFRVFQRDYEHLVESVNNHDLDDEVLDAYGATEPAEFFAVASESFFETPEELRHSYPELYEQLSLYYRLDPASWA